MICPLNGVVNCGDANAGKFFSGLMDIIETPSGVIIAVTLFFVHGNQMLLKGARFDLPSGWNCVFLPACIILFI